MQELKKFVFGTIVCDGCGCRVDSRTANDERIYDVDELLEDKLENMGWVGKGEDKWLCPVCADKPDHRPCPGEGRVIAEREILYGVRCDHCGKQFENYEGYSMWGDESYAVEEARNDDWCGCGKRFLCPDCYRTCDAMDDKNFDVENWKEEFCSKCPHKDDCNEIVEVDVPETSYECNHAVRTVDAKQRVSYARCPYLESSGPLREKCNLPEGKKCPRIETWEIEKEEVSKKNKEIEEWAKKVPN